MKYLLALSLVCIAACRTDAYTWGLETSACKFFTPSHIGKNRRPASDYYQLASNKVIFSPGEAISIRIKGAKVSDRYDFTGILMSVMADGESFGTWEESEDFRPVDCGNKIGSAIADSNTFPKSVGRTAFKWTAPCKCEFDKVYYVKATVVKSKKEFLDGLTLPLTCVHPSKNKADSCIRGYSSIPENATTSFEPGNPGGWTSDSGQKIEWKVHSASTPSPGTGPQNASDGDYYMFMEASFPARKGQRAVLKSPEGLGGCICFRYSYHKYTDVDTKLYATVNGKMTDFQHPDMQDAVDTETDRWINSWISINELGSVEINIVGNRGGTFRGDIALDNFSFAPGMCEEDTDGETALTGEYYMEFLNSVSQTLTCEESEQIELRDSCDNVRSFIPASASTSFESGDLGGWTNDPDAEIQWIAHNGSTPSPGTGPEKAYNGDYYIYMEASFPAQEGHRAILRSPTGLEGCLCFRYSYHIYTDSSAKLYAVVNGEVTRFQHPDLLIQTDEDDVERDRWINSRIPISGRGNVEIEIVAQRGKTIRGDIALDNFSISPGLCEEDLA